MPGAAQTLPADSCAPAPSSSTPAPLVYSGAITVAYSGAITDVRDDADSSSNLKFAIICDMRTAATTLTFSGKIGTEADPVGGTGIGVSFADDAVTITNNGEIHTDSNNASDGRGINAFIDDTSTEGGITVSNNGRIVSENTAIYLHRLFG